MSDELLDESSRRQLDGSSDLEGEAEAFARRRRRNSKEARRKVSREYDALMSPERPCSPIDALESGADSSAADEGQQPADQSARQAAAWRQERLSWRAWRTGP